MFRLIIDYEGESFIYFVKERRKREKGVKMIQKLRLKGNSRELINQVNERHQKARVEN
jgi:hypothetical protein